MVDFLNKKRVKNDGIVPCGHCGDIFSQKQRMVEITKFLKEQKGTIQEYDEQIVRKLIEKITVYDEKVTVAFKSEIEIDVEI